MTDQHDTRPPDGDSGFKETLAAMSLTELQDVFGHLDRDRFSGRIKAVRQEMNSRIDQMAAHEPDIGGIVPAGGLRRLWGTALDVFVSLLPLVIYLGFRMLAASGGGGGGGRGGGRGGRGGFGGNQEEPTLLDQVVDYVTSPEAIWSTVETYGPYLLGFMVYRGLLTMPQLVRTGTLPGWREAGFRVVSVSGGRVTWRRVGLRFVLSYVLGFLTLGISHIWTFIDRGGQTLFDRVAGTRAVRVPRGWEKSPEQRLLED
ncbi:RDD family protein [bacterium]|nr:hypothetical protein [Gemmatimonadota bacterium]MCH2665496.1 RDD family protein [bacterium]